MAIQKQYSMLTNTNKYEKILSFDFFSWSSGF